MKKPVTCKGAIITSPYGERMITNGKKEFHGGIDIAVPGVANVPIFAAYDGRVEAIITNAKISCGLSFFIYNHCGFYCLYFHLAIINPCLSVGDKIDEGAYLGIMGNTGNSRGVHIHYGHRKGMASGTETYEPTEIIKLYEVKK